MLLWDVATRTKVATLNGHGAASFSPDGTILTSGGGVGEVLLWDVATEGKIAVLGHPGQLWDAAGGGVNGVLSPTGALLASVAINGVELWDASEWVDSAPLAGAGICERTEQVQTAILDLIGGVSNCTRVTEAHLASEVASLFLNGQSITALQADDFESLTGLTELRLYDNQLTSAAGRPV